jgi:hypothetical protein
VDVSITSVLDAGFGAALERHGFVRFNNEACSYVLRRTDLGSDLHVDVHLMTDPPHFSVVLQDVRADGSRRELLEDFAGVKRYAFDQSNPFSLTGARDLALSHLRRHGIPWLLGEPVNTPALASRAALASEDRHRRLIVEARATFHAGQRKQALGLLEEAEQIAPLDAASAKLLAILRR